MTAALQRSSRHLAATSIEHLPIPVRAVNVLNRAKIVTIGDLVARTEREISILPGAGAYTVRRIKAALAANRLAFAVEGRRAALFLASSGEPLRRPASDLCFGDARFGFAIGRPGL